jgi:hypothetical protein
MLSVSGQCESGDPDCPCCDHAYDAGRTWVTLDLISKFSLPCGWDIEEALENPLTQSWHRDHVLPVLKHIRDTGEHEITSYPLRQAALASAILQYAPWGPKARCGAAWACIRVGMDYHGWVLNGSRYADEFLLPEEDLFVRYSDMLELNYLLVNAYEYRPQGH